MAANKIVSALDDFEDDLQDLWSFIASYRNGVTVPVAFHETLASFITFLEHQPLRATLKRTQEVLEKSVLEPAKSATESGYSYLFHVSTVRLWTAIEVAINDICVARLEYDNYWTNAEVLKDLRVSLSDFVPLPRGEKVSFVLELLTDKHKARRAPGAGRFEAVLNAIGLGGEVPSPIAERLVWLSAARNCLVHKQGRIDRRVLAHLPKAGSVGEKLVVREHEFARSFAAARAYAALIGIRAEKAGLIDASPATHNLLKRLLQEMEAHDALISASASV